MKKEGYFLIEALIYITLSSLFIILMFQFTLNCFNKYKKVSKDIDIQFWTSIDLLSKDIKQTSEIKLIRNNTLIISTDSRDIGWYLKDNKLYRIEGQYKQNNWSSKIQSLVLYNIKDIFFMHDNGFIKIKLQARKGDQVLEFEKLIFLRNRIL